MQIFAVASIVTVAILYSYILEPTGDRGWVDEPVYQVWYQSDYNQWIYKIYRRRGKPQKVLIFKNKAKLEAPVS